MILRGTPIGVVAARLHVDESLVRRACRKAGVEFKKIAVEAK